MSEILKIFITILGFANVQGGDTSVNMLQFGGHAESEWFVGDVLPGGVDTQTYSPEHSGLSARYMLEGVDCKGDSCKIFIENNLKFGEQFSVPRIVTNSDTLSFLNGAELKGTISNENDQLVIRVFK